MPVLHRQPLGRRQDKQPEDRPRDRRLRDRRLRDVRLHTIGAGTSEIMKEILAKDYKI